MFTVSLRMHRMFAVSQQTQVSLVISTGTGTSSSQPCMFARQRGYQTTEHNAHGN